MAAALCEQQTLDGDGMPSGELFAGALAALADHAVVTGTCPRGRGVDGGADVGHEDGFAVPRRRCS